MTIEAIVAAAIAAATPPTGTIKYRYKWPRQQEAIYLTGYDCKKFKKHVYVCVLTKDEK